MSATKVNLTSPVGRFVQGNLYVPNTKNFDGNPLVVKSGPNAGQPRVDYFVAVAVPKKAGETHWALTEWGKQIWAIGHAAFPAQAQRPDFAWKIEDGDSIVPNKKGKKPCDYEGYKGCWVIKTSGGFAPKICNADGSALIAEPNAVKPGYFVQVNFDVEGNGNQNNAGVYLNHRIVALSAYGEEITFGPDPTSAGFGGVPLPAGASAVPLAALKVAAPAAASTQAAPPPPAVIAPPPAVAVPAVPVTPHPAILNPTAAAPPPPPAAPARVMLAKAAGATYESFLAAGWTDALLIQHGMMAP